MPKGTGVKVSYYHHSKDAPVGNPQTLFLSTKLNRPAQEGKSIPRPRLVSYLDAGPRKRVTLISAPAGFGKTTLAAQWLNQTRRLSAWLSLDSNDNDLERFLMYAIVAIRTVVPGFGSGIEPSLSSTHLPPLDYLADAIVSELVALKDPLVLVLDDYHTISSTAVQKILGRMVEYLPDTLSLVILTRMDPPWTLGRWRSRQWLKELRVDAIAFTEEETRTFFQEYALTAGSVQMIHKRTEGWITALQLVSLSLVDTEDPEQFVKRFSDSNRMIIDYLMDEVISPLPSNVLDFLAVTATLDRFCAPLCNALLADGPDRQDSRQLISLLERENLFLVSLDSERCWYRYHHLFQNLLLHHLKKNLSQERQTWLHLRAGKWFAKQGLIEEALQHFLAIGEVDAAAKLVEENLHATIDEDLSRKVLGRWLKMFPKPEQEQRPALLVAKAWERSVYWDFPVVDTLADRAEALLQKTPAGVSAASRKCLRTDVDVLRSCCLFWQGDIAGSLRHSRRALQGMSITHNHAYTTVKIYSAAAYACSGRREEALQQLGQCFAEDALKGGRNAADILVSYGVMLLSAGDLDAVCRTAEQMLTLHEKSPLPDYYYGYAYYFLAIVAYERNALDIAADYFGHVREMRYRVNTRLYLEILIGMALVAEVKSDGVKVRQYLSEARIFAVETQNANSFLALNAFEIRQALLSGTVPPALPAQVPLYERNMFWLENLALLRAEYLIRYGSSDGRTALKAIENGLKEAQKYDIKPRLIQFQALKALAFYRFGNPDEALHLLEKTLRMAEPQGLVRTFLDRGAHMAALMKLLLKKNPRYSYLRGLLAAFDHEQSQSGHTVARHDDASVKGVTDCAAPLCQLSNREIDVMILLEERLSSKEIAERLFVSPETVRKHIFNIFGKLQVHDRRQAVLAAKKLNLLSPKK